jgi:predicted HTH transcriptional regulator
MSEDRLRAIFAEGAPSWLEEPSLVKLDAQDVIDRLDTQTFFELMKVPYPRDRGGVLSRLVEQRLIDQVDGQYSIRRIGGLLLAKQLDEFPDLARKAPRVIVYSGNSKMNTRIDQLWQRGYATGFQALVTFVMQQMPQNEIIENALRKKVKLLPEDSIRELIANSLIHQDLKIGGACPMIEIYPNRMVISNPGSPIVEVDRFIDGYQSRNERLADFMRRMSICEERGSGIDRVVHEAEISQLPPPRFQSDLQRTTVTVYGPKPFDAMDREDRIRACYQHCALKWVLNERMSNQTLRERFGLAEILIAQRVLVSEVRRNAARELPHSLHLGGLRDLFLEARFLAGILDRHQHSRLAQPLCAGDRQSHRLFRQADKTHGNIAADRLPHGVTAHRIGHTLAPCLENAP